MRNNLPTAFLRGCLLVLLLLPLAAMADENDLADRLQVAIKDGKIAGTYALKPGESMYMAYKSDAPDLNRCIMAVTIPADAPFDTCSGEFSLSMDLTKPDPRLDARYQFAGRVKERVHLVGATGQGLEQPVKSLTQPTASAVKFVPSLLNPRLSDAAASDLAEATITFEDQTHVRVVVEVWVTKNIDLLKSTLQDKYPGLDVSLEKLDYDVSVPHIHPGQPPKQ